MFENIFCIVRNKYFNFIANIYLELINILM